MSDERKKFIWMAQRCAAALYLLYLLSFVLVENWPGLKPRFDPDFLRVVYTPITVLLEIVGWR
jgi:hypothetical protein